MNKKRFNVKIHKISKKIKSVNYLGGKCEMCGETHFYKLCFHHKDPKTKEHKLSKLIKDKSWTEIKKELDKCILLCNNCHTELHNKIDERNNGFGRENKKIFLEFKGNFECEKCGYNKCNDALEFHHIENDDKLFEINMIRTSFTDIKKLTEKVEIELNKCKILCKNCHTEEHYEVNFYEENKKLILDKVENMKIYNTQLDMEYIRELYFDKGMKQIEIVKLLNSSRSTISMAITRLKTKNLLKD